MQYRSATDYGSQAGTMTLERPVERPERAAEITPTEAHEIIRAVQPTPTPLELAEYSAGNNHLLLKREDTSEIGSFKWRGARVKMTSLHRQGVRRVAAASAGNHAQGVALAAHDLGMIATIYVPADAPGAKFEGIRRHGGDNVRIVTCDSFEAAREAMLRDDGVTVEPYDDREVIVGQGTVGLELLDQADKAGIELDRIFVPVGGGGLLAGVAEAVHRRDPRIKVIGVQLIGNDSVYRSFHTGQRLGSSGINTNCDGTAVALAGEACLEKIYQYVHDVIVVKPADLGKAYTQDLRRFDTLAPVYGNDIYASLREPAGMLAEVGALEYSRMHPECHDEAWVAVSSGGNVDMGRVDSFIDAHERSYRRPAAHYLGHTAAIKGATALFRQYAPVPVARQNTP